jgi:quercetin dioxygenase-like cupin family protein
MLRRTTLIIVALATLFGLVVGRSLATPPNGVTAETARGPLVDRQLSANLKFDPGTRVRVQTTGEIEVAAQRVVAVPGATFGWHSHPGLTIVTVLSGTLTLYLATDCTHGTNYGPGTSFSNLPPEIHLARNEGATDLVIFASYFLPARTPPVDIRIDQPSPGPECPL